MDNHRRLVGFETPGLNDCRCRTVKKLISDLGMGQLAEAKKRAQVVHANDLAGRRLAHPLPHAWSERLVYFPLDRRCTREAAVSQQREDIILAVSYPSRKRNFVLGYREKELAACRKQCRNLRRQAGAHLPAIGERFCRVACAPLFFRLCKKLLPSCWA